MESHTDIIAILKDPNHAGHSEMAIRMFYFLNARQVQGVCFGIHVNKAPGPVRDALVAEILTGLRVAESRAVAAVLSFFEGADSALTTLFHGYEARDEL
jgi:hypothetical protein